jgi:hypothetical protein
VSKGEDNIETDVKEIQFENNDAVQQEIFH